MAAAANDFLRVAADKALAGKLRASPTAEPERVEFSASVTKINRKDVAQARTLVVTDKALYNVAKAQIKRRIPLDAVTAITVSSTSAEFVVHVATEYDYRLVSPKRAEAIAVLTRCRAALPGIGPPMPVQTTSAALLKDVVVTKPAAAAKRAGTGAGAVAVGGAGSTAAAAAAAAAPADAGGTSAASSSSGSGSEGKGLVRRDSVRPGAAGFASPLGKLTIAAAPADGAAAAAAGAAGDAAGGAAGGGAYDMSPAVGELHSIAEGDNEEVADA